MTRQIDNVAKNEEGAVINCLGLRQELFDITACAKWPRAFLIDLPVVRRGLGSTEGKEAEGKAGTLRSDDRKCPDH